MMMVMIMDIMEGVFNAKRHNQVYHGRCWKILDTRYVLIVMNSGFCLAYAKHNYYRVDEHQFYLIICSF